MFLASVYRMFKALYDFINSEYDKSSTKNLVRVVSEWEHVFAKDVNLILLKCFMKFLQTEGECHFIFLLFILKKVVVVEQFSNRQQTNQMQTNQKQDLTTNIHLIFYCRK